MPSLHRLEARAADAASSSPLADATTTPSSHRPGARWRAATTLAIALLAGVAMPRTAFAVLPLQQIDIVLLQPGSLIEQRVDGGADAMAEYLKRLGEAETQAMRENPQQLPSAGFIVVAVRPGGLAHAWFDFKPTLSDKTTAALAHVVETVPPTPVKDGNIVFALRVSLWGAKPPEKYAPVPPEWREAGKQAGHKLDLDTLVDQLWPR